MPGTAVIFGHFDKSASGFLGELEQTSGIRASEFVDILIVVAHGNHAHFFVLSHQCFHEYILFRAHILSFIND